MRRSRTRKAVSAWLFSCASACIQPSEGHASSGSTTQAGLPRKGAEAKASTVHWRMDALYGLGEGASMTPMSDDELRERQAFVEGAGALPYVLPVNPLRLVRMAWPLYALIAVAVAVNPSAWWPPTPTTAFVFSLPLLLLALGWLGRGRWRLEFTPEALVHHTLGRTERFEWPRMGPVEVAWVRVGHLPVARTFRFAYPVDDARTLPEQVTSRFGRRLLPIFGDRPLREQAALIEAWRGLRTARLVASGWSVPASALSLRR